MFGIDSTELIVVAVAALVIIGPKDLPVVLRTLGRWVGKVRGMARHFQTGLDAMVREAELEELEKKWREENERIMREYPALPDQNIEGDEPKLPFAEPDPQPPADDTPPAPRPSGARELP